MSKLDQANVKLTFANTYVVLSLKKPSWKKLDSRALSLHVTLSESQLFYVKIEAGFWFVLVIESHTYSNIRLFVLSICYLFFFIACFSRVILVPNKLFHASCQVFLCTSLACRSHGRITSTRKIME